MTKRIDGQAGMQVIRQLLEQVVEPRTASAVIFDALAADRANDLPADLDALLRFLHQPLRQIALQKLGAPTTMDFVERADAALRQYVEGPRDPSAGHTVEVPIGGGPVIVLILSRSSALAVGLRAALGGDRLGVRTVKSAADGQGAVDKLEPEIVIVDAADPLRDDLDKIVDIVRRAPATAARLIWGHEEKWAGRVTLELDRRSISFTSVDRREGVEPLLDLVRSRFSSQL